MSKSPTALRRRNLLAVKPADRKAKKIASLKGTLHTLVPGRHAKFQFEKFMKAIGKSQELGGVNVRSTT